MNEWCLNEAMHINMGQFPKNCRAGADLSELHKSADAFVLLSYFVFWNKNNHWFTFHLILFPVIN